MREAEVLAALAEARIFEDEQRAAIDERMAVGAQFIQWLGGKSKLRGVLGVDDMTFRHLRDGLSIEAPGGVIEIQLDGLEAVNVSFYRLGPGPFGRKRVKQINGVSFDRLMSVLKKHSRVLFEGRGRENWS